MGLLMDYWREFQYCLLLARTERWGR